MEKRHIFLDSNVFYKFQNEIEKGEKEDVVLKIFCAFLEFNFWNETKYNGYSVPDYIAIELKTNKERNFSFLFNCVEVSITNILLYNESILITEDEIKKAEFSLEEKLKIFSREEMIKEKNYEAYQDFKRKIHLLEFRYIFGFIIKIYEKYFGRNFLNIFNEKAKDFVSDYIELRGKKEKEDKINELIREISSGIKSEEYDRMINDKEFLKKIYGEEYERIVLQGRNKKDRKALAYGMVLKLNLIDKVLKNRTFKKKTNNLFDAYFSFSYEMGADILTGDEEMCKRFKRLLNAEIIKEIGEFKVLRIKKPDETYEYFSEKVYRKIIE